MFGRQRVGAQTTAVMFPACRCGHPYPGHGCQDCGCPQYQPSRTLEYRVSLETARLRRWLCETLWTIERAAERWRRTVEGGH